MQIASSARRTCIASVSAVEWTATVLIPISWQARWIRSAISPRLAMRTFLIMSTASPHPRLGPRWVKSAAFESRWDPSLRRGDARWPSPLASFDDHQRLVIFDRLGVEDEHLADGAGPGGDD